MWQRLSFSAAMLSLIFLAHPVYANHSMRQDVFNLVGPLAWGLYVMLPVPFLIVGTIGFLIYRSVRLQKLKLKGECFGKTKQ